MGTINRLSALAVQKLDKPGMHADGGSLYLRITRAKTKGWIFRFSRGGRLRDMGLGAFPEISLHTARSLAADARAKLAECVDPIDDRRRQAASQIATAPMFKAMAQKVIVARVATWRNQKSAKAWTLSLMEYAKPLHRTAVDEITTEQVLQVLRPIWDSAAETASRTRQRIEIVIDYAHANGHIPQGQQNPARWRRHLQHLLPARGERGHHPAMPWRDVQNFMQNLAAKDAPSALCLRMLILTATRSNEVRGMRWDEIEASVWTVPGERTKAGKALTVPLSRDAVVILDRMREVRTGPLVFSGKKCGASLSDMAFTKLLPKGATAHGFRSSFKDWSIEATEFPNELSEMALGHSVGSRVERAYRRGSMAGKRAELMQAWADYCSHPVADTVVKSRAQA